MQQPLENHHSQNPEMNHAMCSVRVEKSYGILDLMEKSNNAFAGISSFVQESFA
jgi:hypothetical protein